MNSLSEVTSDTGERGPCTAPPLLIGSGQGQVMRLQFEQVDGLARRVTTGLETQAKALLEAKVAQLDLELVRLRPQLMEELNTKHAGELALLRAEYERKLEAERSHAQGLVLEACQQFLVDRERYFVKVEAEVVKLSLAIAARVLHRESCLDPLLLQASVRVALGKVAEESGTVLRVPEGTEQQWMDVLKLDADKSVLVVGDGELTLGECVLTTRLGKVELGITAQLAEIERGFFDLLQQRPA